MTTHKDPMSGVELEREAFSLIDLGIKLIPEGEGLDLTDKEYSLENMVQIKGVLARMRTSIDEISRALASAWLEQHGDTAISIGDKHYWVAPTRKVRFQPDEEEPFFEWLRTQDAETIAAIVPGSSLRVSKMPSGIKDAFLDTTTPEPTPYNVRIQNKPRRKDKS